MSNLLHAVVDQDLKKVKQLLKDSDTDPTDGESVAIRTAVAISPKPDPRILDALLKDGRADPAANNNEAMWTASSYGYVNLVELLLKDGRADPAAENNRAIRDAAYQGHEEVVALLFEDPRVRDKGLPFPDPESRNPLARMLGEIVMTSLHMTHRMMSKSKQRNLREQKLMSHIMKYHPIVHDRQR